MRLEPPAPNGGGALVRGGFEYITTSSGGYFEFANRLDGQFVAGIAWQLVAIAMPGYTILDAGSDRSSFKAIVYNASGAPVGAGVGVNVRWVAVGDGY